MYPKYLLWLTLIIFVLHNKVEAQWQATTGPTQPNVVAVATSGTNTFAAAASTVSYTPNNGTNWSLASNGLVGAIYSLATKGTDVFAGAGGGSVFQSSDNGANWTNTSTGLAAYDVKALTVNGSDIYAGSFGVYRSINSGLLWTKLNQTWNASVSSIAVSGSTILAATATGIYMSPDNGASWNTINTGLGTQLSAVIIVGSTFLAGGNFGLYISTNNGANWTLTNVTASISSFTKVGGAILAGSSSGGGVFLSTDGGVTWAANNAGLSNMTVFSLATNAAYAFAGTTGYVFRKPITNILSDTIKTSSNPVAGGTTTGAGAYAPGASVTVTATANNGYSFNNWTENGNVVSSNASYVFTASANRNLVANFTQTSVNYTVATSSNPVAGGSTTGAGSYTSGASVTVTATANNGYNFTNWTESGNVVSANSAYTFTIASNRNLVAEFSSTTAISEADADFAKVYPNPNAGDFVLEFLQGSNVKIYNSLGQLKYQEENCTSRMEVSINESGLYFILIQDKDTGLLVRKQVVVY